jgi:hypothetical protein
MEYEPYKYVKPEAEGYKLVSVKRGWLWNVYTYSRPLEDGRINWSCVKHPNWTSKTLAVVLFPLSVLMAGVPEAWRDTYRHIWDRKYGSFTEHQWWTK